MSPRPRQLPRPALTLAATLAFTLATPLLGCAGPCKKVHASHDEFLRQTAAQPARAGGPHNRDGGAHLSLSIPYELIDTIVAKELGRVPKLKLPLPAVSGVSLGSLTLSVDAVRTRAAPAGELGFRVIVGLRQGKQSVLGINVDARVRPQIDPGEGTLTVALAGKDVIALEPSLDPKGRKQLGDWIWAQLPAAARMVVDKGAIAKIAGDLADQLMRQAAEQVRRELLDDLGELARFELDLPEALPIAGIALRAGDRYLDIDLRTRLQVTSPLPAPVPGARQAGFHPNLVQVRIAGDALAALGNHAIREGRLPERWTLEGEPDPNGPIYVGVGWGDGAADPIEILLWSFEPDCAHVILRGEPHLKVEGQTLELGTDRARVDSVVGSFKVRAGLFFNKTARRGLPLIEQTAAATEVEIAGAPMRLQINQAVVSGDEVVLGLRLTPTRAR